MDPLLQFLVVVAVINVIALPPFIWACNRLERAWWEKRRHG